MLDVASSDAFVDLEAQGNTILRQKPNHIIMIHPAVFFIADGAVTVRSKELAIAIVENLRVNPEEDDEEESGSNRYGVASGIPVGFGAQWANGDTVIGGRRREPDPQPTHQERQR